MWLSMTQRHSIADGRDTRARRPAFEPAPDETRRFSAGGLSPRVAMELAAVNQPEGPAFARLGRTHSTLRLLHCCRFRRCAARHRPVGRKIHGERLAHVTRDDKRRHWRSKVDKERPRASHILVGMQRGCQPVEWATINAMPRAPIATHASHRGRPRRAHAQRCCQWRERPHRVAHVVSKSARMLTKPMIAAGAIQKTASHARARQRSARCRPRTRARSKSPSRRR